MTLLKAVQNFDKLRKNSLTPEEKASFIEELDFKIFAELLLGRTMDEFNGYDLLENPNPTLLAPKEFRDIYSLYLSMKLDLKNMEVPRYNNSSLSFNYRYKEMADFVSRNIPLKKNTIIKAGDLYV